MSYRLQRIADDVMAQARELRRLAAALDTGFPAAAELIRQAANTVHAASDKVRKA